MEGEACNMELQPQSAFDSSRVTYVTAFCRIRQETDSYFAEFRKLAESGVPLLVFTDAPDVIPVYPNVRTLPLEVDVSWMSDQTILPPNRNLEKDTAPFLCLMLAKLQCLVKALEYTQSPYLAWIDFRIFYIVRHTELAQQKLRALTTRSFAGLTKLLAPGCWGPVPTFDILSSVCWRFCGGFLLGPRTILESAYSRQCELVREHLPHLTWEVNYWSRMEEFFEWYAADHNDSMLMNLPYSPRIVRPGASTFYVDGGRFKRFHVGQAIEQGLFRAVCSATEDATLVLPKSDMVVGSEEYHRMKQGVSWDDPSITDIALFPEQPNTILGLDASRKVNRPDVIYYPFDDETFRSGLQLATSRPEWSDRRPIALWRGGTSGVERPTARMRVVQALLESPHADAKFVRGGWPQNDAEIPDNQFGDRVSMEDHMQYKYMLSIDGNGVASSLQWVFGTGCVPLLVIHPDTDFWFKDLLVSGVNCICLKYDLSDLHETLQWLVDNDDKARAIAEESLAFGRRILSPEFQTEFIQRAIGRTQANRRIQ